MNPDPVPPVRPLLTHVIVDEPLRREAGVSVSHLTPLRTFWYKQITYLYLLLK